MAQVTVSVAADADDFYFLANDTLQDGGGGIFFGNGGGKACLLRFLSLGIPQGAVIDSAELEVVSVYATATLPNNVVQFYDEDSATLPTTYADHAGRTLTTASTSWSGAKSYYTAYQLDVTELLQEIVDRAGFTESSNAVLSITSDQAGVNIWGFACSEDATYAPAKLTINYTAPGGSSSGGIGSANFNRFLCPGAR